MNWIKALIAEHIGGDRQDLNLRHERFATEGKKSLSILPPKLSVDYQYEIYAFWSHKLSLKNNLCIYKQALNEEPTKWGYARLELARYPLHAILMLELKIGTNKKRECMNITVLERQVVRVAD